MRKKILAIGILAGCAFATVWHLMQPRHVQIVKNHGDLLENHAISIQNHNYGSHLNYMPLPPNIRAIGVYAYWRHDGFVFYILPKEQGIDEPTEAIIYDIALRPNTISAIQEMYPRFVIHKVSPLPRRGWHFISFSY